MRGIIQWSLTFRLLVVAAGVGLLMFGAAQLRDAPVDLLPEFSPPYVAIQTEALGLSAAEVEELITVPLEGELLNGVHGIDTIRSESVDGLSSVLLIFEPKTNLLEARQLVQERLTRAHILPHVSKPPAMLQPLSSASRVMLVGLSSKNAILIVEFAEQLRESGVPLVEAAVQAATIRLRPILMTSLAFILGVVPVVFASGAGENGRHSVGTTVFGGMIMSTVLNLFFIPVLYLIIEGWREHGKAPEHR
jgi:multidrug efflux pump subunit AcrB